MRRQYRKAEETLNQHSLHFEYLVVQPITYVYYNRELCPKLIHFICIYARVCIPFPAHSSCHALDSFLPINGGRRNNVEETFFRNLHNLQTLFVLHTECEQQLETIVKSIGWPIFRNRINESFVRYSSFDLSHAYSFQPNDFG